jgi:hypothetical protein
MGDFYMPLIKRLALLVFGRAKSEGFCLEILIFIPFYGITILVGK